LNLDEKFGSYAVVLDIFLDINLFSNNKLLLEEIRILIEKFRTSLEKILTRIRVKLDLSLKYIPIYFIQYDFK